ncbi:metalloendoproteinase 1-like [Andrographis paniculata]|uniref:metalloendoproteinase 1-like n=1 Tax=Andrographis paniculata TaxID=175694 RepID=UPI0021E7EA3F|nr:metalloendoproteinase 1-like [Andrographis paniculata]
MAILKALQLLSLIFIQICPIAHSIRELSDPSPFEFVDNLHESSESNSIEGLNKLKNYLKQFGYLNYEDETLLNDDLVDANLESAIKTYQENFNINATGMLDATTIAQLTAPRCGVPDIINGYNTMLRNNSHNPMSKSINIVSHYTFFPNRPRWPSSKTHLTYRLVPNSRADAVAAVDSAFKKWDAATRFSFSRVAKAPSDLLVGFFSRNHGDEDPFDGKGGVLAHAFAPTDGRLHYDADENWVNGAVPGGFDMETVAIHEIGHLLGLGHSPDQSAIMYPTIPPGITKGLGKDDIKGIEALYA